MMYEEEGIFPRLKNQILREEEIIGEINKLLDALNKNPKNKNVANRINELKRNLRKENKILLRFIYGISIVKPLNYQKQPAGEKIQEIQNEKLPDIKAKEEFLLPALEKRTLRRIKEKDVEDVKKKIKKPNIYVRFSNKMFSEFSGKLITQGKFDSVKKNLVKANIDIMPKSYISVIFFTTLISAGISFFIFLFFLFFNFGVKLPIITLSTESIGIRFLKVFWILFVVPAGTFLFMYLYPSMEKSSVEKKMNRELPFATINMAAISGSMIDPTKIFNIIVSTREYPYLEKEFIRVVNNVNLLGYDLVTSLRNSAFKSPSKKLVDLFNGIATTIASGGDLPRFFDERARSLLFEYNLEKEKETRAAETFMDIYISVVIAAPMILMLLLMMMRISGLGLNISTSTITLIMVLGVSIINIISLVFLNLRQSGE
ncbi:MAG: type II secretion system F family protein [Nanoarchaeota archaeon]